MADGRRDAPYVLPSECHLIHIGLQDDIDGNKKGIDKLIKIVYGNGQDGLLWKVNALMLRNQWADKGTSILIGLVASVFGSLVTLYFAGVLNI